MSQPSQWFLVRALVNKIEKERERQLEDPHQPQVLIFLCKSKLLGFCPLVSNYTDQPCKNVRRSTMVLTFTYKQPYSSLFNLYLSRCSFVTDRQEVG